MTAELRHRDFERDASAGAGLLEEQRKGLPGQKISVLLGRSFDCSRKFKHPQQVLGRIVVQIIDVLSHVASTFLIKPIL